MIPQASAEHLGDFMRAHFNKETRITTDKWTGYTPLKKDFNNLVQIPSGEKGGNFPDLHRVIMNLKGWLLGMHHHVNDLQVSGRILLQVQ